MIILEAKIVLHNVYNAEDNYLNDGLRCQFAIGRIAFEAILYLLDKEKFFYEQYENVEIVIPNGELLLRSMIKTQDFDLYYGKKIGDGIFTSIKHIHVEPENCFEFYGVEENLKAIEFFKNKYLLQG